MNAHIGLYFPHFHFPDDEWIKVSALYWDKMYRIVPYSYDKLHDSPAVQELSKGESPFVNILRPEKYFDDLEKIKVDFLSLIEQHTKELVKYYAVENRDAWPNDPYTVKNSPDGNPKLAYLHSDKVENELREVLLKTGLGTPRTDSGPDYMWIGMHPRLVNVYMAALAETLARHEPFNANPVTNDPINYFAVGGFTFERLAQVLLEDANIIPGKISKDEIESRLAVLAIKGTMPKNIQDVPIEKILALRETQAGEFGQFQALIESVVAELPNVTEAEAGPFINDYLEAEYKKKIRPKLATLEHTMNSLGLETIPTIFNLEIKIPPLLAGLGTAGGLAVISPVLGATAAVAFALLKVFSDGRNALEKSVENSDVAYLLHVKEDLAPKDSLEWLSSRARKVMFGV